MRDSGSSGANLISENKSLLSDPKNTNSQFEIAPYFGHITEDSENQFNRHKFQAFQTKTFTNPPKYLLTRILPPKYTNISDKVNASSSFLNEKMDSTSNVNYLKAASTTTSYENNLSSQSSLVDYNDTFLDYFLNLL